MINKTKYLDELNKVIIEKYPTGDYTKVQLSRSDSPVRLSMDTYIMREYGEYYKNELIQLIKEKNSLYDDCINNLNI